MSGIVVDTSALVCIFRSEPGWQAVSAAVAAAARVVLPATCLVEATLLRTAIDGLPEWILSIRDERFEVGEITRPVAEVATSAARNFGKGMGHPAQLNFGDCFSYAVAKTLDLPLLFVGGDFIHTDIVPALKRE